jgi:hypothetical protein
MKILWIGLLLVACTPAFSAENIHPRTSAKRTWVRRATLAAGCAASLLFDTMTTQRVVTAGGVESNGLLADPQGRPQWGRIISLKVGICGASAILQETHVFGAWKSPNADWTWTALNAGTASVYTWAGVHNLKLAKVLSAPNF